MQCNQPSAPAWLEIKHLGKAKNLSITSEMLSNSNESELPPSSSSSSSPTIITINIIRRKSQSQTGKETYEKEESTYPSKDKEKSSKNKSMKEYIYSWKHRDRKETNDFC